MLNEKMIQGVNGNIKNIINRSYTCVNKNNKCFEFMLNDKIYMIYLINNQICLTELIFEGCCFNEIDIADNVTLEEVKVFFTNNSYFVEKRIDTLEKRYDLLSEIIFDIKNSTKDKIKYNRAYKLKLKIASQLKTLGIEV